MHITLWRTGGFVDGELKIRLDSAKLSPPDRIRCAELFLLVEKEIADTSRIRLFNPLRSGLPGADEFLFQLKVASDDGRSFRCSWRESEMTLGLGNLVNFLMTAGECDR